jgi:hypothetical protein
MADLVIGFFTAVIFGAAGFLAEAFLVVFFAAMRSPFA